jgi:hypothetical protein
MLPHNLIEPLLGCPGLAGRDAPEPRALQLRPVSGVQASQKATDLDRDAS